MLWSYLRELVRKNLLQKFQEAEEIFRTHSSKPDSQDVLLEEVVVWRRTRRQEPSFSDHVRSKILEATGLASKDLQLSLRGKANKDSWSYHSLSRLLSNYNFRQFLNGNRDYCNISVVITSSFMKVEGYRMFEVTNRLREKAITEILNRLKDTTRGTTQLIHRDYGKNEKSVNVLILGFHYQEKNKAKEIESKSRRQEV